MREATPISWANAAPIAAVHGLGIALAPWYFTWSGLVVAMFGAYVIAPLGINLTYHRLLAHRSLEVPKWLERCLVVVALLSLQGPPMQWVAVHRLHHRWSDTNNDPHSPIGGFFWSHLGWVIRPEQSQLVVTTYARDLARDPFYRWLQGPMNWLAIYLGHVILLWVAAFLGGWLIYDDTRVAMHLGASVVVWGVLVRQIYVWHITWSINSITHIWGYRTYATHDRSRNNWLLGLLGAGEGWHNNHHHDPASASNWHKWWEIDHTFMWISVLKWLGLARSVRVPRHRRRGRAPTEALT